MPEEKQRVRLEPEVEKLVEANAKANGRTPRQEVNYSLLKFYTHQDNVKTMQTIIRGERAKKGCR